LLPVLLRARARISTGIEVTLVDLHRSLYHSVMVPEGLGGVYEGEEVWIDLVRHATDGVRGAVGHRHRWAGPLPQQPPR